MRPKLINKWPKICHLLINYNLSSKTKTTAKFSSLRPYLKISVSNLRVCLRFWMTLAKLNQEFKLLLRFRIGPNKSNFYNSPRIKAKSWIRVRNRAMKQSLRTQQATSRTTWTWSTRNIRRCLLERVNIMSHIMKVSIGFRIKF